MADLSVEERVKIASGFLLDSPPGEVNDVFNDVRALINNDEALQDGINAALEEYNTDQLITVALPDKSREVIVSKYGQVDSEHFVDPKTHQIFKFDHMRLVASNFQPHTVDEATEPLRAATEEVVEAYIADHFPNGASAVYSSDGTVVICIVDNKYNPGNYWNGRWRSVWTISTAVASIKGSLKVHVHYYEDGNVQLNSGKDIEFSVDFSDDPKTRAAKIIKQIGKSEKEYQAALNESYGEMAENTFKGLRRALPLTRNKLDWNKILNYKIGSELANK